MIIWIVRALSTAFGKPQAPRLGLPIATQAVHHLPPNHIHHLPPNHIHHLPAPLPVQLSLTLADRERIIIIGIASRAHDPITCADALACKTATAARAIIAAQPLL